MSLFISFEGGEGAGKSLQAKKVADKLQELGLEFVIVREPGGTLLGENIRRWVKGADVAPTTELLLFAAARAQLVATVIRPSLEAGKIVIADRYADSTVAYQGHGRRLPLSLVKAVNQAATGGLMPDLTVLLDLPAEQGLARIAKGQMNLPLAEHAASELGRAEEPEQTRFEAESMAFHRRVRSGFLKIAGEEPDRVLVVDASQTRARVWMNIWTRIRPLIYRPPTAL